jgi:hypothetical protein
MALDTQQAMQIAGSKFVYQAGRFYGATEGLGLGVGLIYDGVSYASFDEDERLFDTLAGLVYVLSHECDIDQDNLRFFNDYVLICPIIDFGEFVEEFGIEHPQEKVVSIVTDLASDKIFRAIYIPPISTSILPNGGVIYLNQLTNTHVSSFAEAKAKPVCALSTYAQRIFDYKLQNHLLRPKADGLPRL